MRFTISIWGAVRKNIISDRFSTKTAISAHIWLSLRAFSYLCAKTAISMHFFYDSVIPLSTSLPRSFCESILFVHKALRGSELRLVRTVGMVRLDEILFDILSKKWR